MDNLSLEQLFDEAMKYGRVSLHQCKDDKRFSLTIRFNTIDHVELEACSGFQHTSIKSALLAAIEKAVVIVESMKRNTAVDTEQTQELLGLKSKILKLMGAKE
ncbi:hypothetical protein [Alishewanella sp. HL-SH06]|uniref:hypothetical protein n=1 Tax=Alishewanella sp. HL-SH06 TaxID=3461144 RepID=UPI004042ACDE